MKYLILFFLSISFLSSAYAMNWEYEEKRSIHITDLDLRNLEETDLKGLIKRVNSGMDPDARQELNKRLYDNRITRKFIKQIDIERAFDLKNLSELSQEEIFAILSTCHVQGNRRELLEKIYRVISEKDNTNPMVQYNLGYMHRNGLGVARDYKKASWYYLRSAKSGAEGGLPKAMWAVGTMCEDGHGTYKNIDKAIEWYEKAANNDYYFAYYELASIYRVNRDINKHNNKKIQSLEYAVVFGIPHALYQSAMEYEVAGRGFRERALKLYMIGKKLGELECINRLAFAYYSGDLGLEKNLEKALKLAIEAFESNKFGEETSGLIDKINNKLRKRHSLYFEN